MEEKTEEFWEGNGIENFPNFRVLEKGGKGKIWQNLRMEGKGVKGMFLKVNFQQRYRKLERLEKEGVGEIWF